MKFTSIIIISSIAVGALASCPASVTVTKPIAIGCPDIECAHPLTTCGPTVTSTVLPCSCIGEPPITTTVSPTCPPNGCSCVTTTETLYPPCPYSPPPTTTTPCPASATSYTGFIGCPAIRPCTNPPPCAYFATTVDVPCSCQKKPPYTTTLPATCPPSGCYCTTTTITSDLKCPTPVATSK